MGPIPCVRTASHFIKLGVLFYSTWMSLLVILSPRCNVRDTKLQCLPPLEWPLSENTISRSG